MTAAEWRARAVAFEDAAAYFAAWAASDVALKASDLQRWARLRAEEARRAEQQAAAAEAAT